jgi:DNA-binding CsgD family transcriptional regulator
MTHLTHLTEREIEVWELIGLGHASSEIAVLLGCSRKTVDNHRAKLYRKLGLDSAVHVARAAIAHGLVTVPLLPMERWHPALSRVNPSLTPTPEPVILST